MASDAKLGLMAHLMRRAGFGASRCELEELAERRYEDVVEELVQPTEESAIDEYSLYRYHPMTETLASHITDGQLHWLYHMVNSTRPLEEKMTLFWHQVFATGDAKVMTTYEMATQIKMFRRLGMRSYKDLLVAVAKNPAMIFWLDQNENHKREPNENWGRELLELFSIGVGSYTEMDVKECAHAFTGWTSTSRLLSVPWGPIPMEFQYRAEDHDRGDKSFLGHLGMFNGEDVIDVIIRQPATARFLARHLYNFFVADEPQIPAWPFDPPRDPAAVETLAGALVDADYEMKPVLRTLFNSDFFKEATFQKVRSPAEVFAGTLRLVDDMRGPDVRWGELPPEATYMGQAIMDPPSVEGWHTGKEWINSGALMNRVNFVADRVRNTELPGVSDIVRRVAPMPNRGSSMTADALVDRCLELIGPLEVEEETRRELVEQVADGGPISWGTDEAYASSTRLVGDVLALIAGTREYQMG